MIQETAEKMSPHESKEKIKNYTILQGHHSDGDFGLLTYHVE